MRGKEVVLGLSGGVDSGVAALFLIERGYTVRALYLDIGAGDAESEASARETAGRLGICFATRSIEAALRERVIEPFVREYLRGRTPNPCVKCNPEVKFHALTAFADEHGIAHIATGHYARVCSDANGEARLYMARGSRDQSYMLYRLPQGILRRLILPLGEAADKSQIRAAAGTLLPELASRPDSMEICFVRDGDYPAFVEAEARRLGQAIPPCGDLVDESGQVLGRHKGIHRYTIGKRRGLGLSLASPRYVGRICEQSHQIVLVEESALYQNELTVKDCVWISGSAPHCGAELYARVRHSKRIERAVIQGYSSDAAMRLSFPDGVRAAAPGQSAVIYDGEQVLGGGVITQET